MYLLWLEDLGTSDELEVFLHVDVVKLSVLQIVQQFDVRPLDLPVLLLQFLNGNVLQIVQKGCSGADFVPRRLEGLPKDLVLLVVGRELA